MSGPSDMNNAWETLAILGMSFVTIHPHIFYFHTTLTNQYTQIDGVHPKITHFKHILGCTFLKLPITHTQSMFLLCKLFSMAIHSIGYFCDVTRLCVDEWKLMFFCPNRSGHYIIYFCSTLKSFVTLQLSYILRIAIL